MIYTFNEKTKKFDPLEPCHLVDPAAVARAVAAGVPTIWENKRPEYCERQPGDCTCCAQCCTCGG